MYIHNSCIVFIQGKYMFFKGLGDMNLLRDSSVAASDHDEIR